MNENQISEGDKLIISKLPRDKRKVRFLGKINREHLKGDYKF